MRAANWSEHSGWATPKRDPRTTGREKLIYNSPICRVHPKVLHDGKIGLLWASWRGDCASVVFQIARSLDPGIIQGLVQHLGWSAMEWSTCYKLCTCIDALDEEPTPRLSHLTGNNWRGTRLYLKNTLKRSPAPDRGTGRRQSICRPCQNRVQPWRGGRDRILTEQPKPSVRCQLSQCLGFVVVAINATNHDIQLTERERTHFP
mmetsp:Transcript_1536/g.3803  ORF Transcript_1536/g.3803 Transcript_1536/m.3803 type:complete len:204 (+) Transcript_1536:47-658(+)